MDPERPYREALNNAATFVTSPEDMRRKSAIQTPAQEKELAAAPEAVSQSGTKDGSEKREKRFYPVKPKESIRAFSCLRENMNSKKTYAKNRGV